MRPDAVPSPSEVLPFDWSNSVLSIVSEPVPYGVQLPAPEVDSASRCCTAAS